MPFTRTFLSSFGTRWRDSGDKREGRTDWNGLKGIHPGNGPGNFRRPKRGRNPKSISPLVSLTMLQAHRLPTIQTSAWNRGSPAVCFVGLGSDGAVGANKLRSAVRFRLYAEVAPAESSDRRERGMTFVAEVRSIFPRSLRLAAGGIETINTGQGAFFSTPPVVLPTIRLNNAV
jgi:hypothetical protein